MVSHRQTALLICLTILLITAVKWHNELRVRIDDLQEEMGIVGDALITREAHLESLAELERDAISRCENRKLSKLLYISECKESATTTTATTTTTTGTYIEVVSNRYIIQLLNRNKQQTNKLTKINKEKATKAGWLLPQQVR